MMRALSMRGEISPFAYALAAPALVFSQHAFVALVFFLRQQPLPLDSTFWLVPLRLLAGLPNLPPFAAALAFAYTLAIAWAVAALSFRRASWAKRGHVLAVLAVVPALQPMVVAVLGLMPRRTIATDAVLKTSAHLAHKIQGVMAGIAIIVFAVLVSAVSFGAYGWGLFVLTPITVGLTTAYIANREADIGMGRTTALVFNAAVWGSLALIVFALEGLICIILVSPLAAGAAYVGGAIGHALASAGHRRGKPLLAVALLPAAFVLEAAMPPSVVIATNQSIDIAAPPSAVWRALTSDAPIAAPPGVVARAGLAYPVRARLLGHGVGAIRLGAFSTGVARERIIAWEPERRLAFEVLEQPPAMEEMSPYRRVHAPHVQGYFNTGETRFELSPLPGGGTRLTISAAHELRIDPVPYWEPIARWAVRDNTRRALVDIRDKAEASLVQPTSTGEN